MMVPRFDALISVGGARRALARMFAAAGLDTPALDARVIVGRALALDHAALAGAAERALDAQERERMAAKAARPLAGGAGRPHRRRERVLGPAVAREPRRAGAAAGNRDRGGNRPGRSRPR